MEYKLKVGIRYALVIVLFSSFHIMASAQHSHHQDHKGSLEPISMNSKNIRLALLLGHTLIKNEGSNAYVFIPSWGLDIEYWISHKFAIGLHNDIEIESFIIKSEGHEEVERINPIVMTLDVLYKFKNNIVIGIGPGVELERGDSYYLLRAGLEYEYEINNKYDINTSFFWDQRFDGYDTWTIATGVGRKF